jgi:TolB protein
MLPSSNRGSARYILPVLLLLVAVAGCRTEPTPPGQVAGTPAGGFAARCPQSGDNRCVAVVAVGNDAVLGQARSAAERDLLRAGAFNALDPRAFPQTLTTPDSIADTQWRALGVDLVLLLSRGGDTLHLAVMDLRQQRMTLSRDLPLGMAGGMADGTLAGHQSSDLALQALTGVRGVAATAIAYVAVEQKGRASTYRLVLGSPDGNEEKTLVDSRDPLMSPAWSPDGRKLAYVGYEDGRSGVYILDLDSGKSTRLVSEKGINGSPAWSPDGTRLALTMSFGRNPDIYIVDVASGRRRRLTDSPAIDTEASWSPDGNTIAFTSDRGGTARVYTIGADGSGLRQQPAFGRQTSNPCFSPDGGSLAVVVDEGRDSRIGLIRLGSGHVDLISSGPRDEKPSFAPNGNMLVYSAQDDRLGQLKIRALGGSQWPLHAEEDLREPAWSPYRGEMPQAVAGR